MKRKKKQQETFKKKQQETYQKNIGQMFVGMLYEMDKACGCHNEMLMTFFFRVHS